jgi:hypothetical protein
MDTSMNGTLILRGDRWPIWDSNIDLFTEAHFRGGASKGWLISERFKGNEPFEIVVKGPLRRKGIWYWVIEELITWTPPRKTKNKQQKSFGGAQVYCNRLGSYGGQQEAWLQEALEELKLCSESGNILYNWPINAIVLWKQNTEYRRSSGKQRPPPQKVQKVVQRKR